MAESTNSAQGGVDAVQSEPAKKTEPNGYLHFVFWGGFMVITMTIAGSILVLTNDILPPSISLVRDPAWFSPIIAGATRIDYIGFGIPFVVSIVTVALLYRKKVGSKRLSKGIAIMLIVGTLSFFLSQLTPIGYLVALGKTDFVLLLALSVFLYYNILDLSRIDSVLLAYPVGFIAGSMSDLESAGWTGGVFGGYGFGDGDFLYPISFVVAAVVFSTYWRPALYLARKWQAKVEERRKSRKGHPSQSLGLLRHDGRPE